MSYPIISLSGSKKTHHYKRKVSQISILLTGVQNEYKKMPRLHVIFFLKRLLIESGRLKAKNVFQLL